MNLAIRPVNPASPALRGRGALFRNASSRVRELGSLLGVLLAGVSGAEAAQLTLQFGNLPPGAPPATFRSTVGGTGGGAAPAWKVMEVETKSALPALDPAARPTNRQVVIAQVSGDPTDERFPLLVYEPEVFGDFTATLRFQTVGGRAERMAGLAFRLQDERNYYVVRASSLGSTFRFYKFVDGVRSDPIGPEIKIPSGEWHALEVRCKGNSIRCRLNGADVIPELTDQSFTRGKLALWTKSDSVSYFSSLEVEYDALRTLPQRLVERAKEKYPRLLGITVYAREGDRIAAIASSDPKRVGQAGSPSEALALEQGKIAAGVAGDHSASVFPIRDRNGEPLFAVRLKLRSFAGQTEGNAAARGKLIADDLQTLVAAADASGEILASGGTGKGTKEATKPGSRPKN